MKQFTHQCVLSLFLLVTLALTIDGKRSFGIQRRQKSNKSYSARRGGANASPDNSPIPPPPAPKPISQTNVAKTNQNPPSNDWSSKNAPQGPPPAYPGMGHHAVPNGNFPPAYSPSYVNPPSYSAYPSSGIGSYGGMAAGTHIGGYGVHQPIMTAVVPQKSSSGFSVGSLLMGMAAGHAVSSVVGGLTGGRRQYSETHIHHHYDSSKEQDKNTDSSINEGLPEMTTSESVILASVDVNEEPVQPHPMETIYSFNYAPAYMSTVIPNSEKSISTDFDVSDSASEVDTSTLP